MERYGIDAKRGRLVGRNHRGLSAQEARNFNDQCGAGPELAEYWRPVVVDSRPRVSHAGGGARVEGIAGA